MVNKDSSTDIEERNRLFLILIRISPYCASLVKLFIIPTNVANPDSINPDPDPGCKINKNCCGKNANFLTIRLIYFEDFVKDLQAPGEGFGTPEKMSSSSIHKRSFFLLVGHFCVPGSEFKNT